MRTTPSILLFFTFLFGSPISAESGDEPIQIKAPVPVYASWRQAVQERLYICDLYLAAAVDSPVHEYVREKKEKLTEGLAQLPPEERGAAELVLRDMLLQVIGDDPPGPPYLGWWHREGMDTALNIRRAFLEKSGGEDLTALELGHLDAYAEFNARHLLAEQSDDLNDWANIGWPYLWRESLEPMLVEQIREIHDEYRTNGWNPRYADLASVSIGVGVGRITALGVDGKPWRLAEIERGDGGLWVSTNGSFSYATAYSELEGFGGRSGGRITPARLREWLKGPVLNDARKKRPIP